MIPNQGLRSLSRWVYYRTDYILSGNGTGKEFVHRHGPSTDFWQCNNNLISRNVKRTPPFSSSPMDPLLSMNTWISKVTRLYLLLWKPSAPYNAYLRNEKENSERNRTNHVIQCCSHNLPSLKANNCNPIKIPAPQGIQNMALPPMSPLQILTIELTTSTESMTMPNCSKRSKSLPVSLTMAESELDNDFASFEQAPHRRPPNAKSRTPKSRPSILVSGESGTPKRRAPSCGVKSMIPPAKLLAMETVLIEILVKELNVREAMSSSSRDFGIRISEVDESLVGSLVFMLGCIASRVHSKGSGLPLFI